MAAALIIGLARVVAGVHWPLDILTGFLVAFLSVWIAQRLLVRRVDSLA